MQKITKIKAGGIVIRDDGSFLAVSRKSMGDLSLPKGHLEVNESIEECALREILEETGWNCEIVRYIGTLEYSYIVGESEAHSIVHFYNMRPISHSSELILEDEVSSQSRLSFSDDDVLKLSNLSDKEFISKYFLNA